MMSHLTSQSKFLSLLLRHDPTILGLTMDAFGWVDIQELVDKSKGNRTQFTKELLDQIVATDEKQRYVFNDDKTKIRANQGHSLKDVDVELEQKTPPIYLYHGTAQSNLESIRKSGLDKMSRQYVHLSIDEPTAVRVGKRHGAPVVLKIKASKMHEDGYAFFLSKNNVWLVDSVPAQYIEERWGR